MSAHPSRHRRPTSGALALFVAFLLLAVGLVLAPVALAAGGGISGTVTAADGGAPIEGIEVCAFPLGPESSEGEELKCVFTNAGGEYDITGLATGSYEVEYFSPASSSLNYITQYYNDRSNFNEADPVAVTSPTTTTGIDAQMSEGGRIGGTVTDAATGADLQALVCVFVHGGREVPVGCAEANTHGEYLTPALPAGEYDLGFVEAGYELQYYNGKATFAESTPVAIVVSAVTPGVNAALRRTPSPTPPHQTLLPPAPGGGAAATPIVPPAPAIAASPPAPVPLVKVLGAKLLAGRALPVRLQCANAICQGTIELTTQVFLRHRSGRHTVSRRETLVLARGSFHLIAGKSATVALRLTPAGRARLAHAKRHPLNGDLVLSLQGGGTSTKSVLAG
jgi:Carboxypeptidase regulatory-like domain